MSSKSNLVKYLPAALVVGALALAILLAVFMKDLLFSDEVQQRKVIQQITVINVPPPPPPPPPEEVPEPEPEEEIVEEEIEEAPPEEAVEAPAAEDLGIDADGTAGGDSFGLVARKGGSGLLGGGGYAAYMKTELQKALVADKKLRFMEYRAVVKVWFDDQGNVLRTEVELLDGKKKVAKLLEEFLVSFPGKIRTKPLEAQENYYELKVSSIF